MTVINIDGREKLNCEGGFWTLEFAYLWIAQYVLFLFYSNRSLFLEQIWAHIKLQAVNCIQEIDISLGNAHKRASPWVNNNENHFQVESTVVMWETLAINLFGWLTYFKSILTSLQALQCILCLSHIRHSFIWTTPPLRQNQILGATWLAATRVFYQDKRENTGNDVACSNNLCSVHSYRQELYEIQNFIN